MTATKTDSADTLDIDDAQALIADAHDCIEPIQDALDQAESCETAADLVANLREAARHARALAEECERMAGMVRS